MRSFLYKQHQGIKEHLPQIIKLLLLMLQSLRDMGLLTKVYIVKPMVFPVVMYKCENWTIKKAEHWKTDAFKLWSWRGLLRVPWTTRRSNQSIVKSQPWIFIERTDAEAPILWPPNVNSWLTGKDPDNGKDWGQEEKGVTENKMIG